MSAVHDELEHEYEDLQSRLGDPDLIADQAAYAKAAKRYNELEQIVECIRGLRQATEDVATAKEMLTEAAGDDRDMLRDEVDTAEATIVELEARLRELLLPPAPYMRRYFATGRMDWLPILHARRLVPGLRKLMRQGPPGS